MLLCRGVSAHKSLPDNMYHWQKTGQCSLPKLLMFAQSFCLKAAWRVSANAASGWEWVSIGSWTRLWMTNDIHWRCQACLDALELHGQVTNPFRTLCSTAQVCDVARIPTIVRAILECFNRRCDCGSGLPALASTILVTTNR